MTPNEVNEIELWLTALDIGVDAVIAIIVLVAGWLINRQLSRIESRQRSAATLLSKRLEIFSSISGDVNKIFCASAYVGGWLDVSPKEILAAKRSCDSKFFGEVAFWDAEVIESYKAFSDACFATFQGPGKSAKLRADLK